MSVFVVSAMRRFEVMASRPDRSPKAWRATAVRLRIAACEYARNGNHSVGAKLADRAVDADARAVRAQLRADHADK